MVGGIVKIVCWENVIQQNVKQYTPNQEKSTNNFEDQWINEGVTCNVVNVVIIWIKGLSIEILESVSVISLNLHLSNQ